MMIVQWLILVVIVVAVGVGYWMLRSRASTDPWRNMDQGGGETPPGADPGQESAEDDDREGLGLGGDSYIVAVRTLTTEQPASTPSTTDTISDAAADANWQAYKQSYSARRDTDEAHGEQPAWEQSTWEQPQAPTFDAADDESPTQRQEPEPEKHEPEIPPAPGPTFDLEPEPEPEPEPKPKPPEPDVGDVAESGAEPAASQPAPESEYNPEPEPEPQVDETGAGETYEEEPAVRTTPRQTIEPQPRLTGEQEIFVIHAFAGRERRYAGVDIHAALADQGLLYGFQDIYHRVSRDGNRLVSVYGVANMVNPGTLDPAEKDSLSTPGLTLFMVAPATEPAPATLREMMETANALTIALGGKVLDDRRAVLKAQTAQHMLDRAAELDRRATLAKLR